MKHSLKDTLREKLIEVGHQDIADALDRNETSRLSKEKQDILILIAGAVKNGESIVTANGGIAGFSESSGGSGFLSGVRGGMNKPHDA